METHEELQYNFYVLTLSTLLGFLSVHPSLIEKPLFKWLSKHTAHERQLLQQMDNLKKEQASTHMVDEFAKYSKIQRRLNSLNAELVETRNGKSSSKLVVRLGLPYGVKLVLVLLLIAFSFYYRYTPVMCLGDKVDLTPLTNFICYPNEANCVSFYFWVICSAAVARAIKL